MDPSQKPRTTQQASPPPFDPLDPQWYLNRELTWLAFNQRVLHEGQDDRVPLLERVFFLAVVGSNIDEFFMKRIGGLKQQVGAGVKELSVDGRLPQEQIDACAVVVRDLLRAQEELEVELKRLLARRKIRIVPYADLSLAEKSLAERFFLDQVYPCSRLRAWTRPIPSPLFPTCRSICWSAFATRTASTAT
jgi:polyphosphate kinase